MEANLRLQSVNMNNELKAKELVSLYTYTIFKDKNHDFYWCKCEESGLMQLGGDMESALLMRYIYDGNRH